MHLALIKTVIYVTEKKDHRNKLVSFDDDLWKTNYNFLNLFSFKIAYRFEITCFLFWHLCIAYFTSLSLLLNGYVCETKFLLSQDAIIFLKFHFLNDKLLIVWNVNLFLSTQTTIFTFWWTCITKQSRMKRSINQTWFPWNKNLKQISNQLPNFYWWI